MDENPKTGMGGERSLEVLRGITAKLDAMIERERERAPKPIDWRKVAASLREIANGYVDGCNSRGGDAISYFAAYQTLIGLAAAIEDGLS